MTNTFADALGCDFKRVQFTPDLLPADITGTNIYDAKKGSSPSSLVPFSVISSADEINRAPPRHRLLFRGDAEAWSLSV